MEEVIAPAPSPCTAIAWAGVRIRYTGYPWRPGDDVGERTDRRTSTSNQHIHVRCRAANRASEGEEKDSREHDGPPPNDLTKITLRPALSFLARISETRYLCEPSTKRHQGRRAKRICGAYPDELLAFEVTYNRWKRSSYRGLFVQRNALESKFFNANAVRIQETARKELTNSTAVRRTERPREKIMHQNFQSFGTP